MPKKEILDPQGRTVKQNLGRLGIKDITDIRIGKHIQVSLQAASQAAAEEVIDRACKEVFVNPIMEVYDFVVKELNAG